jgi:hypothetical protein
VVEDELLALQLGSRLVFRCREYRGGGKEGHQGSDGKPGRLRWRSRASAPAWTRKEIPEHCYCPCILMAIRPFFIAHSSC